MDIDWTREVNTFRFLFDGGLHDLLGFLVMILLIFPQTILIGPPASILSLILPSREDSRKVGKRKPYSPFGTETPFRIKVVEVVPIWLAINFLINCLVTAVITLLMRDYPVAILAVVVGIIGFWKLFMELAEFEVEGTIPDSLLAFLSRVALFYGVFVLASVFIFGFLAVIFINLIQLHGSALHSLLAVSLIIGMIVGLFLAVWSLRNS